MSEGTLVLIATISGAIVGFALNEIARLYRERRAEKGQIRSCRTMISLEIDQNLALLGDFWAKLKDVEEVEDGSTITPWASPKTREWRQARRLMEWPLPDWSHAMWQSQMSLLPIALREDEIRHVHNFHNKLNTITAIRSRLLALESEDEEETRTRIAGIGTGKVFLSEIPAKLDRNLPGLWSQSDQIAGELLREGNPLKH